MKKIISFIISSAMLLTLSVSSVHAEEPEPSYNTVMTFGDSIAVSTEEHPSFASLASEYIITSQGADCGLYDSENGRTSDEILNSIKNNESLISPKNIYGEQYDGNYNELYVFISAGGNDYLDFFENTVNPYLEEGDSFLALTPEKTEALKENITADRDNFLNELKKSDAVTEKLLANVSEMVSYIKTVQPEAEIYFLEVYNPFAGFIGSGDETLELISKVADGILKSFNSRLSETEGIHIVPAFDAVKEHPDDFIIENDVHPTLAGHVRIAQLLLSDITEEDEKTILRNMKNGQNDFAPLLSDSEYESLPEYMKAGISDEPEVSVTTSHQEEPETTVSETSAVTTVSKVAVQINENFRPDTTTSVSTTAASTASARTHSSPATSDRGLSSVVISGFFAAAAACIGFRKRK